MNQEVVGEPGVSAFLRSILQNLSRINLMKPDYTAYLFTTQDLEKLKEKLEEKLVLFQGLVVDGEARRLADPGVDKWMDDLKHLLYDVEDILDEIPLLQNLSVGIYSRFEENILARTQKLGETAETLKLERVSTRHALWGESKVTLRTRETSSVVDLSEIHGREDDKAVIVKRLLEVDAKGKKNYDVVGIWGMGGLGKTTLAQLVFNDPDVKKHFQVRKWVCISDVFDVKRATKGLIGDSSSTGDAESLEYLHQRLQEIVESKRFLFVLDDVWPSAEWNKKWNMLKIPFNSCLSGSKILVTTRDCNIAQALGEKKPYQLQGLLEEQCMSLFKDEAFGNADIDEGEKELLMIWGEKIVRACEGLPLAVKVMGAMLGRAKEEMWRAVSEKANLWDTSNVKDEIHPAIRLSYHYLPAVLKRCFEFLAVFPPDYHFRQVEVVRLWIADGLVQEEEGRRVEDIGNDYYNDLKDRSLIQRNNMMHDIVHHLASLVSGKFCYNKNSKKPDASVRHAFVATLNAKHYDFLVQAPCLRTLIVVNPKDTSNLQNTIISCKMLRTFVIGSSYATETFHARYLNLRGDPENLLDSVNHLLNLRCLCVFNSSILCLPDSICTLSELQVLNLGKCERLEQLPKDIGNLRSLRTLDLSRTSISSLPESICALCELEHLYLRYCKSLKQLPKDIGELRSLRTLVLQETSILSLPDSISALIQLQVLNLEKCESLEQLPKDIGNLRSLRTLDLSLTSISSLPESICALCELEMLYLRYCKSRKQLPKDIGELRSLRTLDLQKTSILSLPDSICALSQLQVLNLEQCESLEQLPKDIENLRSLRTLDLSRTSISSLPESICALCELEHLYLQYCKSLKQLPKDIGKLRSLRTLHLQETSIVSVPESILNVTRLECLYVEEHTQLPLHIGRLTRLKTLHFYHVGKEVGRGLDEFNLMNSLEGMLTITNMENIGGVEEAKLADLKSKNFISALEFRWSQPGNDEETEVKIMEALEPHHALRYLTFSNYGGDKFPAWIISSNVCLSKLVYLKMEGLNKICEMIDMEFVSLESLWIENCPILRKVLMATPNLRWLHMMNCGELETDSLHLLPSLSDKAGLHSIVSQLIELECDYNIFVYFLEKLKTTNSKWYQLLSMKLSAGGQRVASLPEGWPSMVDMSRYFRMEINDIAAGNFQWDQISSPYELIINNCRIKERPPHHSYTITSDGKVQKEEESIGTEEVEQSDNE